MRAVIRRFHSPDADLETYSPSEAKYIGILVQILASPDNGYGEEAFDVVVCTPEWLGRLARGEGPIVGRHYLIVPEFDWPRIKVFLTTEVESLEAETWPRLARKISRIAKWEFEDYKNV